MLEDIHIARVLGQVPDDAKHGDIAHLERYRFYRTRNYYGLWACWQVCAGRHDSGVGNMGSVAAATGSVAGRFDRVEQVFPEIQHQLLRYPVQFERAPGARPDGGRLDFDTPEQIHLFKNPDVPGRRLAVPQGLVDTRTDVAGVKGCRFHPVILSGISESMSVNLGI